MVFYLSMMTTMYTPHLEENFRLSIWPFYNIPRFTSSQRGEGNYCNNVPPWVTRNPLCRENWWVLWLEASQTLCIHRYLLSIHRRCTPESPSSRVRVRRALPSRDCGWSWVSCCLWKWLRRFIIHCCTAYSINTQTSLVTARSFGPDHVRCVDSSYHTP